MQDINNKQDYLAILNKNIEKAKRNLEIAEEMLSNDFLELKEKVIYKYQTQIDTLNKLKDNINTN